AHALANLPRCTPWIVSLGRRHSLHLRSRRTIPLSLSPVSSLEPHHDWRPAVGRHFTKGVTRTRGDGIAPYRSRGGPEGREGRRKVERRARGRQGKMGGKAERVETESSRD